MRLSNFQFPELFSKNGSRQSFGFEVPWKGVGSWRGKVVVVCELVNTCAIPCGKHYWSPTAVVGKVTQVIWKRNIYLNINLMWITNCIQIFLIINRTKIDWNVSPLCDQPLSLRFGCSWDNPGGFLPCHKHDSQSFTAPPPKKLLKVIWLCLNDSNLFAVISVECVRLPK